jgi:hypothetical protein
MPPRDVGSVEVAVVNPGGIRMKAPQPFVYIDGPLMVFSEPGSGFSTSDLRDAQGHIVQFDLKGRLIWKASGARLTGFTRPVALLISLPLGHPCQCWLEVRFGTDEGERRAYLTGDYGHDNPATLLDLDVAGNNLLVSRTQVHTPGTFTLSGVVTEARGSAIVPVSGVWITVNEIYSWREIQTDANGAYEMRGLSPGSHLIGASRTGYDLFKQEAAIAAHTIYNITLVAR